jgi:hypothetical protein
MPWDITQSSTEGNTDVPMPAGTASKLTLRLSTALSGSQTATLTLRKNGADTAITCTIVASNASCTDYTHTATFVDGDMLSIRYSESSSPSARVKYSFLYTTE